MTFARLGLSDPLLRALATLGYKVPTPVQVQAVPAVLGGRDLLAAAQTGTGKTAGFALPLLQRLAEEGPPVAANSARALVLVPTRELAGQVCASIRAYGQHLPLRTCAVYGGVAIDPQRVQLRKGMDVVVATPGRLLDLHRRNALKLGQVRMLVLDEADRMLDLGFSRELDAIFAALPRRRQTLLFSATFADAIRAMAGAILNDPVSVEASPRNAAPRRVRQWAIPVDKRRKPDLFCHLLKRRGWGQVLVFVRTRKGVEQLVATLLGQGVGADSIHGDKPQPARLRALERFKAGEARVLVATDVAARGLDIDDLPVVVNFDLPIVAHDYIHRIGRTGRAGAARGSGFAGLRRRGRPVGGDRGVAQENPPATRGGGFRARPPGADDRKPRCRSGSPGSRSSRRWPAAAWAGIDRTRRAAASRRGLARPGGSRRRGGSSRRST
jgi:ATP-dependent RNA helicase RhlE